MNDIFILTLSNSKQLCLIDMEDYEKIKNYRWLIHGTKLYVKTNLNKPKRSQYLHKTVFGEYKKEIDHINRLPWDNRKSNLREVNRSQNQQNRVSHKETVSKYKGVTWRIHENLWHSRIRFNGKLLHLGYFKTEKDAAIAYNKKASELYGDYAFQNPL